MKEKYRKQVSLLLQCLPWIAQEKDFALKGGTAINLFVQPDFPRLSVDIDLTYIKVQNREASLSGIESGLLSIKRAIERNINGSYVNEVKNKAIGITAKLEVQHENSAIKIEPNLIIRGTVFPNQRLDVSKSVENNFQLSATNIPVVSYADLYAGKICAALDRQHPRDLFDIGYLLKNSIDDKLKYAFIIYLICNNRPMHELLAPNLLDIRDIFRNEFLGMSNIDIRLEALLENRVKLIKIINEALGEKDKQFLLSVSEGSPDFKLFPIGDVQYLPAIRWKLFNINKMDKKKQKVQRDKLEALLSE